MTVRTTCPYCGVGCGVLVDAEGVRGDPDHPANRGRLCSKGAALAETLGDDGRLLHPTIGGRRVGWDVALDHVAQGFSEAIAAHGPDSVAFYVSGQLLTEDYYVANKLMKGFIGSANIDTNSRLCMASTVAGHIRAFGEDIVPGCYEDLELADMVVLVGSNAAWCHPVLFQRLLDRPKRIVVIDPRRTATCESADLHLQLRPGTDVALFNALLADDVDLAAETGVERRSLETFFAWWRATERTVTLWSQGVNQSSSGTDKVNAIINCHVATGRIGRPGMGPFSLTGQPNAMGGREVGGLATQLAAHMGFEEADLVARFWKAPRIARKPGLKAVELFDAVLEGRIRALWVIGTNPAASLPRAGHVRAALDACSFLVVSDVSSASDTAAFADVLLPAAAWGEKDGTVTNSERRISRQRAFRPPPGEARPDWWSICEVARRMGWSEAFRYGGPAEIFREHAALSGFENAGRRAFDISALAGKDFDAMEPTRWGPKRFRLDGRLVPARPRPAAEQPDDEYPLVLNTGRLRDQWHTMTRTGRLPRLMSHTEAPFVAVHPKDAKLDGLQDGGLARIETRHGAAVLPVRVSGDQRPGEAFVPMHWSAWFSSAGPIDQLVGAAVDPLSGQPELKFTAARIAPVAPRWRGVMLRHEAGGPLAGDFFWARVPLEVGEAFELTGWGSPPALGGELVEYSDPARGVYRAASIVDGRLDACLYVASGAAGMPPRAALASMLGEAVERISVLAGRSASAAAADRIVCACFSVGLEVIAGAIRERRLATVKEIGTALRAGTNCGSCVPELQAMLRDVRPAAA